MIISLKQLGSKSPEQGTQEWLDQRKGLITGSKPAGLTFDLLPNKTRNFYPTENDWQNCLEEWFGDKKKHFPPEALKRMDYGSKTEYTAAAALLSAIPNSVFYERPLIKINDLYSASPDGFLIEYNKFNQPLNYYNVEIKCVLYECINDKELCIKKMKQKKAFPYYYAGQILMEMLAQNSLETLFICYTPYRSHIWKCKFNNELWRQTHSMLMAFKDQCCDFKYLQLLIGHWTSACRRYANDQKLWKVIDENKEVTTLY